MSNQSDKNTQEQVPVVRNVNLLRAINESASLLLTVNNLNTVDDVLLSTLSIIGDALDSDIVQVWRDEKQPDTLTFECIYTWKSEFGEKFSKIPQSLTPTHESTEAWYEKLGGGECIIATLSTMKSDEQEFFSSLAIKSIYFIPLFCNNALWGFLSINDCAEERSYDEEEIVTLKSIGLMIASVLNYRITTEDLVAINKRADAASKSKNAFLSNMSHEMRTPLNAIVGMTIVGKDANEISEKNRALGMIEDASVHLLDIITTVLDMAQIEEDKLVLTPAELVFREALDNAVSSLMPLADEKNQTVKVNIDDTIPRYAIGDKMRLCQLVANLVSNAVKFTPNSGRIWVDAILKSETDKQIDLQIIVKDNGIGIPEDQLGSVFMPFEQAHGALNHSYGGTGLGLAISKRIAELMGGNIRLDSEENRGTIVYVEITLEKSLARDSSSEAVQGADKDESDDGSVVRGEFEGKRLLIAEDIEINREILIALLKNSKLIIECAEDGQVALDMVMFNVDKYDIIFMDLQMPNMGGLESTRHIRRLPERARGKLPIIAMTANVMAEDISACKEAGMDDHLGKPLDIEKVLKVLRKYLSAG